MTRMLERVSNKKSRFKNLGGKGKTKKVNKRNRLISTSKLSSLGRLETVALCLHGSPPITCMYRFMQRRKIEEKKEDERHNVASLF